jgi:hypothetical protein
MMHTGKDGLVLDRILKGIRPVAREFFFSDASSQGELVKLQEVV